MAVKRGNGGVLKFGAGVVIEVTDWAYDEAVGVIEKPAVMGETVAVYDTDGRKTGTGSFNVVYDDADAVHAVLTAGAVGVLEIHEKGTALGTVKHSGSVVIGSVGKAGGAAEFMKRALTFSGVLTQGVN